MKLSFSGVCVQKDCVQVSLCCVISSGHNWLSLLPIQTPTPNTNTFLNNKQKYFTKSRLHTQKVACSLPQVRESMGRLFIAL